MLFLCSQSVYLCLPQAWKGICTLVFLVPDMDIITEDQDLPIPLTARLWSKRAIQAIPLLVILGITAAMGMGAAGMGTSTHYYTKLSNQLVSDLQIVAESILTLQKQLDSLVSDVLQNRWGLDLLTAEKGGLCLFLKEECCFYVNQSGVVKNKIRQLQEQLQKWRRELEHSWNPLGNISQWFSWLMSILMPIFLARIFLSFLPSIIKTVQRFLLDHMSAIANQKFNQLYLQGYQPLQNCLENYCEGPHQDATGAWGSCPIQCPLPAGSS
jgi:hypothetical protein